MDTRSPSGIDAPKPNWARLGGIVGAVVLVAYACLFVIQTGMFAPAESYVPAKPSNQTPAAIYANAYQARRRRLEAENKNVPVIFIGDSITDLWETGAGAESWSDVKRKYSAVNYGVCSDSVASLQWRLTQPEFQRISPRVVVLEIGTNSLARLSPARVANGIRNTARQLKDRYHCAIIVVSLLPKNPNYTGDEARALANVRRANYLIKTGEYDFADVYALFTKDSMVNRDLFVDGLHPNLEGYRILQAELGSRIDAALNAHEKPH